MTYEWITFRQGMVRNLFTLAKITAVNSTAALAFENESDAKEVLSALRVEKDVVAAGLYDKEGKLFAKYPDTESAGAVPNAPEKFGHRFAESHLIVVQPV